MHLYNVFNCHVRRLRGITFFWPAFELPSRLCKKAFKASNVSLRVLWYSSLNKCCLNQVATLWMTCHCLTAQLLWNSIILKTFVPVWFEHWNSAGLVVISKEQEAVLNSPLVIGCHRYGWKGRIQKPNRSLLGQFGPSVTWTILDLVLPRLYGGSVPTSWLFAYPSNLATVLVGYSMIR